MFYYIPVLEESESITCLIPNIIKMGDNKATGGKKPTKRRRKKTIRRPTKKEDKSIL